MAETKKKKGWPRIGTVRKGDDGGSYIKLDEGVEVFLNGEKVALNEKRTVRLEDPRKTVEKLYERGIITEKEHDTRLEKLVEMQWLKYDMIVPPPKGN